MKAIRVALAGNPNTGKTTIFNNLTGGRQKVGNYPGVTVEKKSGWIPREDCQLELVDLPGVYSLGAASLDEQVTRDYLLRESPDVIVNVVDASNLERSLYLTTQLLELDLPLVLAVNMADLAAAAGIVCNYELIAKCFCAPVVCLVGNQQTGTEALLAAVMQVVRTGKTGDFAVHYGEELRVAVDELAGQLQPALCAGSVLAPLLATARGRRWCAARLLEHDEAVWQALDYPALRSMAEQLAKRLAHAHGESPAMMIADARHGYISGVCMEAVKQAARFGHSKSDKIDVVLTHRLWGMPIFLAMMFLVFKLTFALAEIPMRLIEQGVAWGAAAVAALWPAGQWLWLESLLVNGIIAGVGGVLVFLPSIVLLFMSIAILEHSGYMARAAFIMDRLMHKIGLHGKSFIPMIIGFGCTVPAILATRTLDSRRDRLLTMFVLPLMSCGARFTIYSLVIPAFFPHAWCAPVLWLIYFIGIVLAIAGVKLLGVTWMKATAEPTGMVIELPPYHRPTVQTILIHMWERAWLYLQKAGTIILLASVVMWCLMHYPTYSGDKMGLSDAQVKAAGVEHSAAGIIGKRLQPVLAPMGFDWRLGTALLGTVAAKEVFVSQMAVVLATGEEGNSEGLRQELKRSYTPLTGFCILLFTLIGFPCAATVAVMRAESGAWRYALLQFVVLTVAAWCVTALTYQIGRVVLGVIG